MENEKKKKCVIAIRLSWFDVQVAIRILLVACDRKPNPADLNKKGIYQFKQMKSPGELTSSMT